MHPRLSPARYGSAFLSFPAATVSMKTVLTTERLKIRPFLKKDADDFYEYMSLEETYRFERGQPVSRRKAAAIVAEFSKTSSLWAVTLAEPAGKLIGHISFFQIQPQLLNTWEIGFIFNPRFQNHGYATEASRALISYAFTKLKAHRITATCSPDNIASWKVLEKCGMRREGLYRKNFLLALDENGAPIWLDSFAYAILEDEFQEYTAL